ncbi:MAG: hypothetical protein ACE5KM_02515 [Planctomycetaceae bacterium]
MARILSGLIPLGVLAGLGAVALAGDRPSRATAKRPAETPKKQLFTGKVVLLKDAFKRRGIPASKEIDKQVALETPAGELIPLVPDWRGRAFFQDKRLRDRKVQLVGYRRKGVPYLNVLMVFTFNKQGERQYTDYWCDICSIPMYEIKRCECCQGPIRLRFQTRALPDYLSHRHGSTEHKPAVNTKPPAGPPRAP